MPDIFLSQFREDVIHLPVQLFSHPLLQGLSFEALMLYGMLLCAQELGDKTDENGEKYAQVTLKDVARIFRCGSDRAKRIVHELDPIHGAGLIRTRKFPDGHTATYVSRAPKQNS